MEIIVVPVVTKDTMQAMIKLTTEIEESACGGIDYGTVSHDGTSVPAGQGIDRCVSWESTSSSCMPVLWRVRHPWQGASTVAP